MIINVNGKQQELDEDAEHVTYAEVVAAVDGDQEVVHMVTWHRPEDKCLGSITVGQSVRTAPGMVFDVVATEQLVADLAVDHGDDS